MSLVNAVVLLAGSLVGVGVLITIVMVIRDPQTDRGKAIGGAGIAMLLVGLLIAGLVAAAWVLAGVLP